eukprot:gene20473-21107_t
MERTIDCGSSPALAVANKSDTFAQVLSRYQAEVSARKRSGKTEAFYLRVIQRHQIGGTLIRDLKATSIRGYRDDRLKDVSTSTVRNEMALILHALRTAKNEWGLPIREEVFQVSKPPAGKARTRRLEDGEAETLLHAMGTCRNPLVMQVFKFALATGMRRGEVLSLQWSNVDIINRTAFLPITKNGDCRTVPLSTAALMVLNERRGSDTASDLVFPISPNAVRLSWERIKKRAGILNLRFHDLRHEAISRFFELGLSVPEVALISGHKDPRMLVLASMIVTKEATSTKWITQLIQEVTGFRARLWNSGFSLFARQRCTDTLALTQVHELDERHQSHIDGLG